MLMRGIDNPVLDGKYFKNFYWFQWQDELYSSIRADI